MPVVVAISAAFLAYRAGDKPVLLPVNHVRDYDDIRANTDGFFSTADGSSATYPLRNLLDLSRATQWRYANTQATVYILIDAGPGETLTVDSFVLEGTDASLNGGTVRVRCADGLNVAPNDSLDGTAVTLLDEAMTTVRLVKLLNSTHTARYWEVRLQTGGNTIKKIRQMWFASQVFIPHKSRVPYDRQQGISEFVDVTSKSGRRRRNTWFSDLARRDFDCWINDLNTIAAVRAAFASTLGWGLPIWWVEDPTASPGPTAVFGYVEESGLDLPSLLSIDKEWKNAIIETGPHLD